METGHISLLYEKESWQPDLLIDNQLFEKYFLKP